MFIIRHLSIALLLTPTLFLALGWFGWVHPVFDSIAVFRQPILWLVIVSVAILVWLRAYLPSFGAVAIGLVSSDFLWPTSTNESATHSLYQKNMSFRMRDHEALLNDILKSNAEFVTLQEVTEKNKALLKGFLQDFPSQHYCDFTGVGGVAVASIYPKVKGSGVCHGYGAVSMQVQTDQGAVWVSSVHLHWPWPFGQAKQVEKIIPKLKQLPGPNLIAGDFNMVPWSHLIKSLGEATNTRVVNGVHRSFPLKKFFTIPIDHALVPILQGGGHGELRPLFGSDHLGLLVHFRL